MTIRLHVNDLGPANDEPWSQINRTIVAIFDASTTSLTGAISSGARTTNNTYSTGLHFVSSSQKKEKKQIGCVTEDYM